MDRPGRLARVRDPRRLPRPSRAPAGLARTGLTERQLRGHAPEFHPTSRCAGWSCRARRWPSTRPRCPPGGPPRRARPPGRLDTGHLALPVHPLTAGPSAGAPTGSGPLAEALRATGLDRAGARLAERPHLRVRPTLSMRTVAVADDPLTHLKLPLATATLGLLNQRSIKPGTLVDGRSPSGWWRP
ncbi:IucA/IucC family protein [Streptomyces sp. M19]